MARQQRIEKLAELAKLGIEAYPASSKKDLPNSQITADFDKYDGQNFSLTGKVMSLRKHGPLMFIDLMDDSGKIQLFITQDVLEKTSSSKQILGFDNLNLLDSGDFIQAEGTVIKTKTGQVSLQPKLIKLLCKSLRPMPDKWEGITDTEVIYRRRYLDLVINPDRREMFKRKARFWQVNREFLSSRGFLEVETPVLEHVTGGADARPFTTHMNALDQNFFLRISTELYQKRLIGGGFEKVFTIGPNFRNEGLSDEHLPEYYQVEWYWAYADYRDNMKLTREMFIEIAQKVYGRTIFTRGEHSFDLSSEWPEIDYASVIKDKLGIDIFHSTNAEMLQVLKKYKIKLSGELERQRLIDNLWKIIRKTISGPAFLVNEPKFMSPLAKSKAKSPELTERFHIVLAGSELGNGYSELNDPQDQLARFKDQQKLREKGDDEAQMLDIDYVEMLEYGMPPTSGYAHSERLFWFLEGVSAREGTLFPQLKKLLDETTKEIYGL